MLGKMPPLQTMVDCYKALHRISLKSGWDDVADERATWLCRIHGAQLCKYRSLTNRDRRSAAAKAQEHILRSHAAKFTAALRVAARVKQSFETLEPISLAELEKRAASICPYSKPQDAARLKLEIKADGSYRPTLSFGARSRATQRLVEDVLDARGLHNQFEFNTKGKGPAAALTRVKKLVEQEGVRSFLVFDVASWFPSLGPKHLDWLHLPSLVQKHTVFMGSHVHIIHDDNHHVEAEAARRGLPQGAALSGKIASVFLGRELSKLCGEMGKLTFADDGLVYACSHADMETVARTLERRFANHPGGPLSFKTLHASTIDAGFSFLGNWVQKREDANGEVAVGFHPSHSARTKFQWRLFEKLNELGPTVDFDSAIKKGEEYLDR